MSTLARSITPLHATALVVGIIIGASIFVQPSVITGTVPTMAAVYAVWLASGVLTLFGALIAAELASAYPVAGGVYVFLREAFSPVLGFLWGWAMFWTMHTGIITVIASVFARYAAFFVPVGDGGQKAIAAAAIALLTAVNCLGVRQGSLVQTSTTIIKVSAIAVLILLAYLAGGSTPPPTVHPSNASATLSAHSFGIALVAGLFAFGGWHMVTYAAEETHQSERTIPRALVIGVLLVTACYVALSAAYAHLLTPAGVAASKRVAADAADAVFGTGGAAVMSALVAVSTFGALNGVILAGPRAYVALARDGLFLPWAAEIHPRFHTPVRAILLQGAWAVVLLWTGTYRVLFSRVVYTEWIFFALMAAGLIRLRRRPGYHPAYRMWGVPVIPVVFILSSAYVVVNEVLTDPRDSMNGLLFVLAGLPVYWLSVRRPRVLTHSTPA